MKTSIRHYARSSSFQMALLFTVLCGAAVLVLGYFSYYFTRGHFIHGTEAVIDTEIRYLDALPDPVRVPPHPGRLYIVFPENSVRPDNIPHAVSLLSEGIIVFDQPETGHRYAAKIHTLQNNRKILVGVDITDIANDHKVMQGLALSTIVLMLTVIAVSYMISIFVVKGTNKIADTARDIMETGDLSRRINVGSPWDDLGNMAQTLNVMLDRIQELMRGVRQVSDNIAHDLRTPLTRLRNHIESIKKSDPENVAYDQILSEADHLLSTFNALLRIARLETEKQKNHFTDIDLNSILSDVISFYEPLAEEKKINIHFDGISAPRHGDRDLLFQAFANLLDNAIKFTPIQGTITIAISAINNGYSIEITDSGTGIPEADLSRVFERFYRAESSRSTPGSGLGLSLVAAVIQLHDGRIELQNVKNGLQIITIL